MWRYAVAWAKHQVGIEWDMKHWNEEDRTKISAVSQSQFMGCAQSAGLFKFQINFDVKFQVFISILIVVSFVYSNWLGL